MTSLNIFGERWPGLRMDRHDKRLRDIIDQQPNGRRQNDPSGDERTVTIPRWVLTLVLSTLAAAGGFISRAAYEDARVLAVEKKLGEHDKAIEGYEQLKIERERRITALETAQINMARTLDQINAKLDRALYGRDMRKP